ncbi:hypothetical protein K3G39_14060 [Pontibacter sp. HSC-14F20]|uniref:hypothetical protein n=1 Tax=Pontibacter sp. HSC-14F20 TaxID=2864136 RepID=UPI001C72FE65|nr:hypothetical protein [Pontibacter sp. HSC-14F20]MBX0334363.1 hypothetical protein [Pontibacter sp. HSC-14F20]
MLKKWKSLSVTASLATILMLGVTTTPNAADLNNGNTTPEATTIVAPEANTNPLPLTDEIKPLAPKKEKSVLDADVLESPLSFFKDLSSRSEEEESSDLTVKSSTIVLALKALAATLLSTIM